MNEYKMTFNALNMAAKDLERKLPILAPFQTVDEQKQLVMLVSFLLQILHDDLSRSFVDVFTRPFVPVNRNLYFRTARNNRYSCWSWG